LLGVWLRFCALMMAERTADLTNVPLEPASLSQTGIDALH
jgi:hypothetical protein